MENSRQIIEPDEVVFTLRTEACGPIDPCDPETRDWKVSLKNTYKGAFLVGSETWCPSGEKKRRYRFMVPWDWAESVRKQLENWSVPIAPKFEMGYDGGFTELTCGGYCGKSSYRWWSAPPPGWEPLDRFAGKVFQLFHELRQMSDPRFDAKIHRLMMECPVVGMSHVEGIEKLTEDLDCGSELELVREPENRYDSNAVAVHLPGGERIGYIPRERNSDIARLMDQGRTFSLSVVRIGEKHYDYPAMDVFVYMDLQRDDLCLTLEDGAVCREAPEPVNRFEECKRDCVARGLSFRNMGLQPADVKDDVAQWLRGRETVEHTMAEKEWDYLEEMDYAIEVPPAKKEEGE